MGAARPTKYKVEGYQQMKFKERITLKEFRKYDIQEVMPCVNVLSRSFHTKPHLNSKALRFILPIFIAEQRGIYCTKAQFTTALGITPITAQIYIDWLLKYDFIYRILYRENRKGVKYRVTNKGHDVIKTYMLLWDREIQRLRTIGIDFSKL